MIGTKLKSARLNLRFNQEEMAHELKTIRSSVSQWESDKSDPTLKKFVEICNRLKISPNEMLGWESKEYSKSDMLNLIQSLKDYTLESHNILGHDEREPEEFFEIWSQNRI